jgi:hypothetical protein
LTAVYVYPIGVAAKVVVVVPTLGDALTSRSRSA